MAFYDIDGKELTIKEFVDYYSTAYYLGEDKIKGITYTQSSMYIEEQIVDILNNGIREYSDFAKAMAWKIGKIKHLESQEKHSFIYHKDWIRCEMDNPLRYKRKMGLKDYYDSIMGEWSQLEELAMQGSPQACLDELKNKAPNGIGTVYLITILFFLSHGKYPIYDRFAMAALDAYDKGLLPAAGSSISLEQIPTKTDENFKAICGSNGFYRSYIDKLNGLGYDYSRDRRLDQALWVYGHGFKVKQ